MALHHQNEKAISSAMSAIECKTSDQKTPTINMPLHNYVEKRFDKILKSPNDKRLYRGLVLSNQMKVLIISDPTTDKSAAALDVNIGYLSDPDDLPGLAHFCEHMLFLETEKYPQQNAYNMYLSQNSGSNNAFTHLTHTNYYFDVNPDKLEGALDLFAQYFIGPLFTETSTESELNAVHSEHMKNLATDTWRLDQLDKSSADPNHPYSKFGTGNRETLDIIPKQRGINVRERLLKFHKDYYSANIMSLCVLGKESLDELEAMVVDMFSKVENKNVKAPVWYEDPFNEEHFETKWFIVPIRDMRNLNISFPIPDLQKYYNACPIRYISHLLGHEGEGSLLSALKNRGWCNSLISGKRYASKGFNFFNVFVDLTEDGIEHVDDIIVLIFQYINMLKKEGPVEWIFNECKDIADMNFRFEEKVDPRKYVSRKSQSLQDYPMEEVLTAEYIFSDWRPDLINQVMEYLVPQNIRVHVLAKIYEDIADETEKWYGTKFKKERIPKEIINKYVDAGFSTDLRLPDKNEFIPTKFDIKPLKANTNKFPVIIQDTSLMRLWFKQDDEFFVPKANLTFDFVSPLAYIDPISCNLTYMFVQLFQDALNEYAYTANLAGLKWEISNSKYGITLMIGGYNDKQNVLLNKIMDKMVNFTVDPKRFEVLKESYIRSIKDFEAEQPYQHAVYYLAALLSERIWVKDELLKASSQLTVQKVQEFIPQLLSKVHIECFMHGNITMSEALETASLIETKLTTAIPDITPLLPKQLVLFRETRLEDGCHFLYEVENKLHKSSCTEVYYQTGLQSTEANMLLELLAQIISEPCFNVLRTKEQLGYIVFSGIRRTNGSQGLRIIVQSDRHPQYVEERIDAFLDTMLKQISSMTEEDFNKHKESLATQRLEKPKKMRGMSMVYWNEITLQQYNFDRANIEVAYLRTITQEQILQFFKEAIHSDGSRKLSVHVISTAEGGAGTEKEDVVNQSEQVKKIEDVMSFKISQSLYPLLQPYINIPRKGACSSKL